MFAPFLLIETGSQQRSLLNPSATLHQIRHIKIVHQRLQRRHTEGGQRRQESQFQGRTLALIATTQGEAARDRCGVAGKTDHPKQSNEGQNQREERPFGAGKHRERKDNNSPQTSGKRLRSCRGAWRHYLRSQSSQP